MYSVHDPLARGLPHSDIHGSKPARGSPWLFAACHVLHRLLVPRHPPNALLSLKTLTPGDHRLKAGDKSGDPPCTETILRNQSSVVSRRCEETTPARITNAQTQELIRTGSS